MFAEGKFTSNMNKCSSCCVLVLVADKESA